MTRRLSLLLVLAVAAVPPPAAAQTRLSLAEAIARAQAQNLDARSADAAERQAVHRVDQARAGYFPIVDISETWQQGNQPVFVFGSLLAQRRFAAPNFAIDALNHPEAIGNRRTALTAEQAVFDPTTRTAVRAATLGHELATTGRVQVTQGLTVAVTGGYGAVLSAVATRAVAGAAVATAIADLELARNRRDAGVVTDADVLQLEVALARTREQQIRAEADLTIARARLNQVLGEPLDVEFVLEEAVEPVTPGETTRATLEASALADRPEVRLAVLHEQLAASLVDSVRAVFLPRLSVQAAWEANGDAWDSRASSWMVGAVGRINLFRGFGDRARVAEARAHQTQRAMERQQAEIAARLDVRVALARLEAARASEIVGRTAAALARESHRIIRDRYESGLVDVSALVRAAEVIQQADARQVAARVDIVLAAAELNRAVGKQ